MLQLQSASSGLSICKSAGAAWPSMSLYKVLRNKRRTQQQLCCTEICCDGKGHIAIAIGMMQAYVVNTWTSRPSCSIMLQIGRRCRCSKVAGLSSTPTCQCTKKANVERPSQGQTNTHQALHMQADVEACISNRCLLWHAAGVVGWASALRVARVISGRTFLWTQGAFACACLVKAQQMA